MAGDWIKLHRSLLDSEQMQDDWLCRLFVWCLLRANYSHGTFRGQHVAPGQFVTGRVTAASELGVSPSKWYRGVRQLEKLGCLVVKANSNWTTLTLCNWDTYQNGDSAERTASEQQMNSERTASGQQVNTIEEGKKERRKEGKKNTPPNPPAGGTGGEKRFDPRRMPIPAELSTPEFHRAWSEWCAYRSAKRKPISEIAAKKQINKLLTYGPVAAVAAIEKAMESDWQSVHPEGLGAGSHARNGSDDLFGGLREFVERHEQYEHEQS